MDSAQEAREFVLNALGLQGMECPVAYKKLLRQTPANRVIEHLDPWFFPLKPEQFVDFCSKAAGRLVLPFVQAVEEDLIACFVKGESVHPKVLVINPWAGNESSTVLAELPDFDAWLNYADQVSRQVMEREQEEECP